MASEKIKKKFIFITTIPVSLFFFKGQIKVLKKEFDIEVISGSGEELDEFCELENVKGHRVAELEREISLFADIKSLLKFIRFFKKLKPDIIHGNTPKGALLSMLAGWLTRVPHRIYCVHGLRYQGAEGFQRKMLMSLERMSCRLATDVFTVSYGVKEILKEDNICKKKINIIWNGSVNGINSNHFSPNVVDETEVKKEYNIDSSYLIFGFVGRLVRDKGINELIEAFVKINKKHASTRLLLVGNYEDSDPVTELTRNEIATNKNIIYVGRQSDVRPFLKLMDVFLFPSYREGFGVSLMEAAAMNTPAISSNITGCNEIIKDGYNGKLIASKSAIELEKAMSWFVENPKLRKQMSDVTRQHVIDKYEQKELWDKALEAYLKVANNV